MTRINLTLNGRAQHREVEPRQTLADFLRDGCDLTGTHLGCEHGACGACTVLIDGLPARSCIHLAVRADGCDVRSIEGLRDDPLTVLLRRHFHEAHALQCGYCTPGMLVTARDILRRFPAPDEATIRRELAGQICRCTGYVGIVEAIRRAGAELANQPS
ncbi:(2Fe-2S)-binding protein [Roseomonas sp. NAR14]|uniref:(2Fe-2S)-binding protein n=1 Tax=Roseomonas acroporae TaxID=2937791 RepID=A0A9X2BVY2_9PROT|nr:(2Fe-2S)-binding protein [Roseomonas acroporae]MCK8784499.1 (2Fe-2S)-binding protein [Roseomonas acroporae]